MERSPAQDTQSNFELSLRDQLIAAQNAESIPSPQRAPSGPPPYPDSRSDQQHVDPIIGGPAPQDYSMQDMDLDDALGAMAAGQKDPAKRELSSSKRAAQNRAAQRAFRQRKEAYIGKLEQQVNDYRIMEDDFKALQRQNHELRLYVTELQGKLMEVASELPPRPAAADGGQKALSNDPPSSTNQSERQSDIRLSPTNQDHDARQGDGPSNDVSKQTPHDTRVSAPAPIASMTTYNAPFTSINAGTQAPGQDTHLTQAAVDQLRAAATEAGGLGDNSAPAPIERQPNPDVS